MFASNWSLLHFRQGHFWQRRAFLLGGFFVTKNVTTELTTCGLEFQGFANIKFVQSLHAGTSFHGTQVFLAIFADRSKTRHTVEACYITCTLHIEDKTTLECNCSPLLEKQNVSKRCNRFLTLGTEYLLTFSLLSGNLFQQFTAIVNAVWLMSR